jgi:hypothetical protein
MRLYHISLKDYKEDEILKIESRTEYSNRVSSEGMSWIDEIIDSFKPSDFTSRSTVVFAFDNPLKCQIFADEEDFNTNHGIEREWKIYEVEMSNFKKGLMPVTKVIKKCKEESKMILLAKEYWRLADTPGWNFIEYMSFEMKIIKRIDFEFSQKEIDEGYAMFQADVEKIEKVTN